MSPASPQNPRPRALPLAKKLLFAMLSVTVFFALLEGLLALCGVRPLGDREDLFVGFAGYNPLFIERASADGAVEMVTADRKLTWFNRQQFPKTKPAGTVRIFCVGGSTTYGHPYDDRTSYCAWLREFLPVAEPSRQWEVINAGGISYASYREARLMEELADYQPDLFIVDTGQNEFLERRTYGRLVDMPVTLRSASGWLSRTRTLSLVESIVHSREGGASRSRGTDAGRFTLPAEVLTRLDSVAGLDEYVRDDELAQQVVLHFRSNLRRMADIARGHGARVLFVVPASNLADSSPFKSQHQDGLTADATRACDDLLAGAARQLDARHAEQALPLIERALQIDDRYADAHFLHGRCLLAEGRHVEALDALIRARDEDVCPLRAISPLRAALFEAARDRDVPAVDFEREIAERSGHGIAGEQWFLDHVHPTIEGHRVLALALIDRMVREGIVVPDSGWNDAAVAAVSTRVTQRIDSAYQAQALRTLSKTLGWAGKHDEADRLALQAVALNPRDAEAQYQAGNALYRRGDLQAAWERYQLSKGLDPTQAQVYYGLGLVQQAEGQDRLAIDNYRAAILRNPVFVDAYYNLGNALARQGQPEDASRQFRRLLEINPRDCEAWNNLGLALAQLHRADEAEHCYHRAIALRPKFIAARLNLALLHFAHGADAAAAAELRELLQEHPDDVDSTNWLAWILATSEDRTVRDVARAQALAETCAAATDRRDPQVLETLAAACAAAGEYELAVRHQSDAIGLVELQSTAEQVRRLKLYESHRPYRPPTDERSGRLPITGP